MARPTSYSPAEDAIIAETSGMSHAETNERLINGGYQPRSQEQIKQRRYYLSKQLVQESEADTPEARLSQALTRRLALTRLIEANAREREQLHAQVAELNMEIHGLMESVKGVLDR